ncbi:MAG TPA: hypothetical protein VHB73_01755 [Alphaproteobacteria bacterium]|nr:hypothetical protein [Alphaproteobacteria bacterium]
MISRLLIAACLLASLALPARADDAAAQAQNAADTSSTGTSALTPERAATDAGQTFDNPSPSATTPDGADLQPKPFSATPNN